MTALFELPLPSETLAMMATHNASLSGGRGPSA